MPTPTTCDVFKKLREIFPEIPEGCQRVVVDIALDSVPEVTCMFIPLAPSKDESKCS